MLFSCSVQSPSLSNTAAGSLRCFRLYPNLAQVCLYKQTAVAGGASSRRSLCHVSSRHPRVEAVPRAAGSASPLWPPLPRAGCRSLPRERVRGCCSAPGQADASTWAGGRMPHERVMTAPTQLWHDALDTLPWQPRSAPDDCDFPLNERRACTSPLPRISPLPLYPLSHRVKAYSYWNLSYFSERDSSNPAGGEGESTNPAGLWLPPCRLVTAHPAAVNVQ